MHEPHRTDPTRGEKGEGVLEDDQASGDEGQYFHALDRSRSRSRSRSHNLDHGLGNLDIVFAAMRCCARGVSCRSHPADTCIIHVSYKYVLSC